MIYASLLSDFYYKLLSVPKEVIRQFDVYVYGKLRACVRGFSEGKSDASKQSNSHWLS